MFEIPELADQECIVSSRALHFFVNGKEYIIENPDSETLLIDFLRENNYTGTKLGCGEGGCGACTVMVSYFDAFLQRVVNRSINSCLAPLCSIDCMSVITVEGIGSTKDVLHPIQEGLERSFSETNNDEQIQ